MATRLRSRRDAGLGPAGDLLPPHSVEAEQAVLGGLFLDPLAWDQVADMVTADDFYRPDHRLIFAAISELAASGKPIDLVTVTEHLTRRGQIGEAGGVDYLTTVARDTPTAANARAYAEIVRERSLLRKLVHAGREISASVFAEEGASARDLVDLAEQRVFQIAEQSTGAREGAQSVARILPPLIDQIDEWHSNPNKMRGLPTGFTDFDHKTGGLRGGDLIIVAGRPSMGKTTLAINMAEYAAINPESQATVAIFSMEMPSDQVVTRMLSSVGHVPLNSIRSGQISNEDWDRITSATSQLKGARIFIDESPALTPTELRARARRIKREHGLGLVVVDYLQLMQVPGTQENRATEIAEISRGLKALAKELSVPVIALSQLNRSVEQRTEKKPVMSDLRECVTGDTLVCLADGRRVPIAQLVGQTPEVWTLDDKHRLTAARTDLVWAVGRKPVRTVHLASGRTLRATDKHRLLCGQGWRRVGDLAVGERIALAHCLPEPTAMPSWPDHELILLAHLVGDGSYLVHQPLRYTTASEHNSRAVAEAAVALGSKVTRQAGRGQWHQLVISGNGNRWHACGVGGWLKRLGIYGQRSHQKHLPEAVFTLPNRQVALLLRHLWATDGSISLRPPGKRGSDRVYFSTCSQRLAKEVAALLLRFGIVARLRVIRSGANRPVHNVDISGAQDQRRFLEDVGGFGPREMPASRLDEKLRQVAAKPNVDTLPVEVMREVRALMNERGVSLRAMAAMRGTAYGGTAHFRFAPSRATLASYAELLDADALKDKVTDDLFWDRVVAIGTEMEDEEVYDLTVPGTANWLADGIVSHNSGAIEQDADLILLIYRDEVYDKNSTKRGMAEIDLAKHRNGETGTFVLTFQGQYARFTNYVSESYAEGVLR